MGKHYKTRVLGQNVFNFCLTKEHCVTHLNRWDPLKTSTKCKKAWLNRHLAEGFMMICLGIKPFKNAVKLPLSGLQDRPSKEAQGPPKAHKKRPNAYICSVWGYLPSARLVWLNVFNQGVQDPLNPSNSIKTRVSALHPHKVKRV